MATATISLEDYLKAEFHPDVEFVRGELKERPMVMSVHGVVQIEVGTWFRNRRTEWNIRTAVEVRTKTTPDSVRLPDVVVDVDRKWPQTLVQPPLIVIEVLSPSDSMVELEDKCDEYTAMGIRNVWMINPHRRTFNVWHDGGWTRTERFQVADSPIYLERAWLFEQIDSYGDDR